MFIKITDYVQAGLKRLITQYYTATNFKSLLTAYIQQMQIIEDELFDMNIYRYLQDATGQQLDNIGKIVGLTREPGLSDSAYRLELLGQIKINISQGQPEQVIQVFLLFTGATQVRLFEEFPAEVLVESSYYPPDQDTTNKIIQIMEDTAPAGVRVNGIVSYNSTMPFAYRVNVAPGAGYNAGKYGTLKRSRFPFAYRGNSTKNKGYGTKLDPLVGGAYIG